MFKTFILFFAIASSPDKVDWQPIGDYMTKQECKSQISNLLDKSQGYNMYNPKDGIAMFINPANLNERILLTCVDQVRKYEINN